MKGLLVTAAVVAILALACGEVEQRYTTQPTSPTVGEHLTPSSTPVSTPTVGPAQPYSAESIVSCVTELDSEGMLAIEQGLLACLSARDTAHPGVVYGVEGRLRLLVISLPPLTGCCRFSQWIAWMSGGAWRVQDVGPLLGGVDVRMTHLPYARSMESPKRGPSARQAVVDGVDSVAVIFSDIYGSAAEESYVLFSLDNETWSAKWTARVPKVVGLAHTRVDFQGKSIDTLWIHGNSWLLDDEKSQTFWESNPGPHRYFEQTWVRQGYEYVLLAESVVPSPYNTLVEFVYALSTDDYRTAASLVSDVSFLDSAKSLGLVQDPPGHHWTAWCGSPGGDTDPPCIVVTPDSSGARLEMVAEGAAWIISGIQPCAFWSDSHGGHCD